MISVWNEGTVELYGQVFTYHFEIYVCTQFISICETKQHSYTSPLFTFKILPEIIPRHIFQESYCLDMNGEEY